MKNDRGLLLTILINFLAVSSLVGLKDASETKTLSTVLSILGLLSLYGIWTWKKWGLYLQIVVYIISFAITISLFSSQKVLEDFPDRYQQWFFGWMIVWGLIPVILGYFALKKRWQFFKYTSL